MSTGYTAVARGAETDAVIAKLAATGLLVGDSIKPAGAGFPNDDTSRSFTPYAIVYSGVVGQIDGPVGDPFADTVADYQVTSIGVTGSQSRFVADKARAGLLSGLAVAGRTVQIVAWSGGQPVSRDDSVTPPLFYTIDTYAVTTSPA